jgi:hypothetical protein
MVGRRFIVPRIRFPAKCRSLIRPEVAGKQKARHEAGL